jgi:hypothetical protein
MQRVVFSISVFIVILAGVAVAQQSSLVLSGGDVALCHHNDTAWTLSKTANAPSVVSGATVTWTLTATRGATSNNMLDVNGFVAVTNGGGAPATIGNIIVNLQRQKLVGNKQRWLSASANVSTAFAGDAATSANLVATGSQEDASWNAACNSPATYAVAGARGTFSENAGSGTLEFTDMNSNTIWAITPQQAIPAGQTVFLFFRATFNNSVLQIPAGTQIRAEVLATFGNAGARGNGGSSATSIDVNGDGIVNPDENNVRTVPTRITRAVPGLEACNDTVTVTDDGLTTSGTVTSTNYIDGGIGSGASISSTSTWSITAQVDAGSAGGSVCNTAHLTGASSSASVVIGADPLTLLPITYSFDCCVGANLTASECVLVESVQGFSAGDYCTYSKGGYAGPGAPGQLLTSNFATVFAGGLTIGINDAAGSLHHAKWTTVSSLKSALGGGGSSGPLTADTSNATSISGGTFARQTAALAISVAFSAAGVTSNSTGNFGDLYYCNAGSSLSGQTVSYILGAANTALAGKGLPAGYTFGTLNTLIGDLNEAFDNCTVSTFATQYLSRNACQ